MKPNRGKFITFEGGEGAGKTTLIESLAKKFAEQEISVIITREPGGTKLGEHVRNILLSHSDDTTLSPYAELALFLASRAQHIQEVIKPAIEKGKVVLCDRFNDSSIAYQGLARGLGMEKVAQACSFFSSNLEPDLTFFLDIDPKVGLSRNSEGFDRIESEEIAFHNLIRDGYLKLAEENPARIHVINAELPPAKVYDLAFESVSSLI